MKSTSLWVSASPTANDPWRYAPQKLSPRTSLAPTTSSTSSWFRSSKGVASPRSCLPGDSAFTHGIVELARASFANSGPHRRLVNRAARIASVREAELEDFGSGLTPVTQGWFVVNVRDAEWWFSERRGARCPFEREYGDPPVEFAQPGLNVTVLQPGQTGLYHAWSYQAAFLRRSGACA